MHFVARLCHVMPPRFIAAMTQRAYHALAVSITAAQVSALRTAADGLVDDLTGALVYDGHEPLVYLLLGHPDGYSWQVVSIERLKPLAYTEDRLLDLIACKPETPTAEIAPDLIKEATQQARALWMQEHPQYKPEQVKRICALYLHPRGRATDISSVLQTSMSEVSG